MCSSLRPRCSVDGFSLVPELPRFDSSESYTSGEERSDTSVFPCSSPALQRHIREEEFGLVALSCHFALDVLFLSMDH